MGRGHAQAPRILRLFTVYYRGMSVKELECCMAISPVTPFLSSSSQYVAMDIIVLSYRRLVKLRHIWQDFLPVLRLRYSYIVRPGKLDSLFPIHQILCLSASGRSFFIIHYTVICLQTFKNSSNH